jgi:2-polyprenyl-6-methoxyphenol hydroxylase-like FAD-dependent oxidoreductase
MNGNERATRTSGTTDRSMTEEVEVAIVGAGPTGLTLAVMLSGYGIRTVVGCDGGHSLARGALGIPFQGETYPQSFVLADVRMSWALPDDEVQLFFSPEGLVVVAPLPQGHHRVVATVDGAPAEPSLSDVQALLDARGPRSQRPRVERAFPASRMALRTLKARGYGRVRRYAGGSRSGHAWVTRLPEKAQCNRNRATKEETLVVLRDAELHTELALRGGVQRPNRTL